MVYGAIDLHMRYSQTRIIDEHGTVGREQRVLTTRERLRKAFEGHGPMRILLETGTESEWVARALGGTRSWWPIPITRRCMASCGGT